LPQVGLTRLTGDSRRHEGARGFQPVTFLREGTHSIAGAVIETVMAPNWLVIWVVDRIHALILVADIMRGPVRGGDAIPVRRGAQVAQ